MNTTEPELDKGNRSSCGVRTLSSRGYQNKTRFRLDTDYHFIVNPESKSRFYPLAGIQLAFNSDAVKFGLNAGGGFNFMLTDSKAAFAEAKFVFGSWDGFAIMGGIYF